ncbi:MAG: ABC transporter substrate-binding protein, partial [Nitrolancea sp.]
RMLAMEPGERYPGMIGVLAAIRFADTAIPDEHATFTAPEEDDNVTELGTRDTGMPRTAQSYLPRHSSSISRRAVITGLGGIVVAGAAGGVLLALRRQAGGASRSTSTATDRPSPTNPITVDQNVILTPTAKPSPTIPITVNQNVILTPTAGTNPLVPTEETSSTSGLATDQTLKINSIVEPNSFDFNKDLYCNGDASCFAMLAQFGPDLNVIPDIAEKWEANADASIWTFHLRDSKWSNGTTVTAGDYEWSWKRQLDPVTAAPYAGFLYDLKNAQDFNLGQNGLTKDDVGVSATDDQTLVVTLEGPRAYFPVLAAYVAAAPSFQPAVEKYGDRWTEAANIVCNGPFTLTDWKHNESYTLTKNDNYWNASTITLKQVNCPIVDTTSELAAYQNDEIDISLHGTLSNLTNVQSDATLKNEYHKYNLFGTWYLEPNVNMAPFDNKNVRLAMAHAIDRQTLVNNVLHGLGTVAYTQTPPGMPGYDTSTYDTYTSYDPEKAKSLLRGTPYEGGMNWPAITMTQRNNEGDAPAAVADSMIVMLRENLGMNIQHELGNPGDVYNRAFQGRVQLMWWRWYIDYPDPNNTMYLVWYSKFPSGERNTFSDQTFDNLVTQAVAEPNQQKRFQMYWQADQILIENGAAIFVYNPWNYMLVKSYVTNIPTDKSGNIVPNGNIYSHMSDHISITQH